MRTRVGPADDVEVTSGGLSRRSFRDGVHGAAARQNQDRPGGARKKRFQLYPRVNLMEKIKDWKWTVVQTFLDEFRDFRRLIEGERGSIAEGFDGFRALEMAQAVYRSVADGRSVRLCEPF